MSPPTFFRLTWSAARFMSSVMALSTLGCVTAAEEMSLHGVGGRRSRQQRR